MKQCTADQDDKTRETSEVNLTDTPQNNTESSESFETRISFTSFGSESVLRHVIYNIIV